MSQLVIKIITGLSGSGKSTALRTLEDQGFFCIDNLPAALIIPFTDLCEKRVDVLKVAIGIDVRGQQFWEGIDLALGELQRRSYDFELIFLEATDEVLQRRFSETRRPHPLSRDGDILSGIEVERQITKELKARANLIVDTTQLNIHQLRSRIIEHLQEGGKKQGKSMVIRLQSFGYKYGIPLDSDMVFDVRFIPNPFFEPQLRQMSGYDEDVINFVMSSQDAVKFIDSVTNFLVSFIPGYEKEGKAYLTISIGCTGGRHRSVVIAEQLALRLKNSAVQVFHRDIEKG